MKTFTDAGGRTWSLQLNLATAKKVRDALDVDLLEPESGDPPLITRLGTEPVLLGEVLCKMLESQFETHKVTEEDVLNAFDGNTLLAAQKAFYEELHDFFLASGRKDRAQAVAKQQVIIEDAVEQAAETANKVTVGPGSAEGRHIGTVVNATQWQKIQDLIQKGIDEGAKLVAGGPGRPDGLNKGFYVRPTVFADVTNDMTIAREEIFGPVMSIHKFADEAEAVEIANDTPYGLTNYVQSTDDARRNRMARQLRSGMVEMNGESRSAGSPFGGMKQSGNGREGGVWGIEDFLEVKSVSGWAAE